MNDKIIVEVESEDAFADALDHECASAHNHKNRQLLIEGVESASMMVGNYLKVVFEGDADRLLVGGLGEDKPSAKIITT